MIFTPNAIESLNRVIRKAIKTRGSFPSGDAAEKLIYLAIKDHEKTATTVRGWPTAVNPFAVMVEDRFFPMPGRERSYWNRTGGRYTEFLTLLAGPVRHHAGPLR